MPTSSPASDLTASVTVRRPYEGPRLQYLDSIRGLASLSVVFFHVFILHPVFWTDEQPVVRFLRTWPVRLAWGGGEAVICFFVLSGFVLALPTFETGQRPSYRVFALRRVLRIYPPFLGAYLLTALMFQLVSTYHISGLTTTFNDYWNRPLTWPAAASHALMLTHANFINPAAWSLVDEMRVSLVFPALLVIAAAVGTVRAAALFAGIGVMADFVSAMLPAGPPLLHVISSLLETVPSVQMFMFGIALASNRTAIIATLERWPTAARVTLFVVGLALMGCKPLSLGGFHVGVTAVGLGFSIELMVIMSSVMAVSYLQTPILVWLGKISYSLYLLHTGVLFSLFYTFHRNLPLWLISLLVPPVALISAALFHRAIEIPSIRLSRTLPLQWFGQRSGVV